MKFLKVVNSYVKKHVLVIFILVILIILVTISSLVPPIILSKFVDEVLIVGKIDLLMIYAISYASIYIIIGLTNFLKEFLLVYISQGITKSLRLEMIKKIHNMKYQYFINYDSSYFESYINNDVEAVNTLISAGVISMVIDCFKIVGIVISIFIFSKYLGYVIICIIPLLVLLTFLFKKLMFISQYKNRVLEGNVNTIMNETVDNIKTIKTFNCESHMKEKYNYIANNHYRTLKSTSFYDGIFAPLMQIIKTITITLVIVLTIKDKISAITIGTLVACIDLITNLFSPIENLGTEIQSIQKSLSGVKRINDFLSYEQNNGITINSQALEPTIELKNVSFGYNDKAVIHNFNLCLKKGDKVILTGKSGIGKTTIFKLICGIIAPSSGDALINQIKASELSDCSKYKIFAILNQEPYFSGGTIYEEVTLKENYEYDNVKEVLRKVGLGNRIVDLNVPFKEDEFSTGEKVLINVARILLKNPQIILLDELNSKIDSITAKKIIKLICEKSDNKIIISICHYTDIFENFSKIEIK